MKSYREIDGEHKFANAEDVRRVYDALDKPRGIRDASLVSGVPRDRTVSAMRILEYRGVVQPRLVGRYRIYRRAEELE
jgi:hypothetical protein